MSIYTNAIFIYVNEYTDMVVGVPTTISTRHRYKFKETCE